MICSWDFLVRGETGVRSKLLTFAQLSKVDSRHLRRWFETRSLPSFDSCAPAHLKLGRVPASSPLPSRLCLDHSHCPVLVPATLAALPSTRAIPNRDVFHVAFPKRSIPSLATCSMLVIPSAPFVPSVFSAFRGRARTSASSLRLTQPLLQLSV